MFLSTTSQTITAVLSGAATPAPTYATAFHSDNGEFCLNGTLSATAATIVSAPVSGRPKTVDFINIYNSDDATAVVTVNLVDGSDTRALGVWTLLTGEGLFYVNGRGWSVIDGNGRVKASQSVSLADGENLALGTTTGTKIGTGATQKLGFWNATPVVQPVGAAQAAVTPSTSFTGSDTVDKATVLAAVQAVETLANALRTALVNAGIIKGAA